MPSYHSAALPPTGIAFTEEVVTGMLAAVAGDARSERDRGGKEYTIGERPVMRIERSTWLPSHEPMLLLASERRLSRT